MKSLLTNTLKNYIYDFRRCSAVLQRKAERNKVLTPKIFVHYVLILFYRFRDEKRIVSGCLPLYQNKLQEQGFQAVVNMNKTKCEPFS